MYSKTFTENRQKIMSHYRNPLFRRKNTERENYFVFDANFGCCSDDIKIFIKNNSEGKIVDIFFNGIGCAIAVASTDIMMKYVKNNSSRQVLKLVNDYEAMIKFNTSGLQKHELSIFQKITNQQNRQKCALMISSVLKLYFKKIFS